MCMAVTGCLNDRPAADEGRSVAVRDTMRVSAATGGEAELMSGSAR